MREAARKRPHLVTMLCPPPHGLAGDLFMRKMLEEKQIGRLLEVRLRSLSSAFLDPSAPPHWRQRVEISGVNVLTLGIYVEVLQRWLGPIRAVTARGTIVHPFRHHYEVRMPDSLNVLAEFENGAEGVLQFSGVAVFPPHDELELYGTRGSLSYDFSSGAINAGCIGDLARQAVSIPPELTRRWTVEADFMNAVRHRSEPRPHPNFEDGVAYMRVAEAVSNSVATQKRVEVSKE
jgi:predicted dehydrogenase